jgi:hypothetical protein
MVDCYWLNLVVALIITYNFVIDKHFLVHMGEKVMQEHRQLIKRAGAEAERQLDKPAQILKILWD